MSLNYLLWNALGPQTWFLWAAMAGLLAALLRRPAQAARFAVLAALLGGLVGLSPLGYWLMCGLESRYPSPDPLPRPDGLVVLAGAEHLNLSARHGMLEAGEAGERLMAAATLAHRFAHARIVLVGGLRSVDGRQRDIDLMRAFLVDVGVRKKRIVMIGDTANTLANAQGVAQHGLIRPGQTWLLVTSASHMPRAMASFAAQGLRPVPYPVDHRADPDSRSDELSLNVVGNIRRFDDAAREWVGLGLYRLLELRDR